MKKDPINYADDDILPIKFLIRLRVPSLLIGLLLGLFLSFVTSQFEDVIAAHVEIAFFLPLIVYLADAVGTQTQTIYTRDLKSGKADFKTYLFKESFVGFFLGLIFGGISFPIVYLWLGSPLLATALFFSIWGAIASAPIVSLLVTELLQIRKSDPAVGAGPIATVIQDTISVMIYGLIATAIIFK